MATNKRPSEGNSKKPRPATTPQGRENQMIDLAFTLAEQQMRNGTASAQVVTHYLKLGSSREKEEQQRLRSENEMLKQKMAAMATQEDSGSMYAAAIEAMTTYKGLEPGEEDYFEE